MIDQKNIVGVEKSYLPCQWISAVSFSENVHHWLISVVYILLNSTCISTLMIRIINSKTTQSNTLQKCKTPSPAIVLDMTLNYQMMRLVLKLKGMLRTPLLPSFTGPIWPRMEVSVRIPPTGLKELFKHLTVCKQITVKLNRLCKIPICETICVRIKQLVLDNNAWITLYVYK